jgi:hypothetical protein
MGGTEFKKEVKKGYYLASFSSRQQSFEQDLNIFQTKLVSSKFLKENKISDRLHPTENELKEIISNNIEKAKELDIKNSHIIFLHYFCKSFVENFVLTKNYDIFKILKEIINNLEITDEEKSNLEITEKRFEKEFPTDMTFVNYNLNLKDFQNLSSLNYLGINSNLKFEKNFQPEMLTLILDDKLLEDINLVKDIADLITNCSNLIIVNYILYPRNKDGKLSEVFGLDGETYQSLFALIKAVTVNKKIKSFVFHSVEYYNINLAPEICRLIEQKLQSETLVSFHFGNFNLNENWVKKLDFLLASTKSLLFLSLENKNYTKDYILDFKNVMAKNRSIMTLSIVSPIFKGMKKEVVEKMKESYKTDNKDSKLEFIYFSHQSLIDKSWIV